MHHFKLTSIFILSNISYHYFILYVYISMYINLLNKYDNLHD